MRPTLPPAVLAVLALLAACGPTIRYERDPGIRLGVGARWAWSLPDDDGLAYDDGAITPRESTARLIVEAVEAEMAARGFVRTSGDSADFVMHFHLGRRSVTDTLPSRRADQGRVIRDAPGAWGGYGRPETIAEREITWDEGMLVLDALTPDLRTVAWRGLMAGEIPERAVEDPGPAIRAAVKRLLRGFP